MSQEESKSEPLFTKQEKLRMGLTQTGWMGWFIAFLILFEMLIFRQGDLVMVLMPILILNCQVMALAKFLRETYPVKK